MPEEFSESWIDGWLQKGYRPVHTATYNYQNVAGHDVVRKSRFALMRVSDGKDSGEKTFVVQHRSRQSVLLGAARWESGIGKEGWETDLLYRRVELELAIANKDTIYLCEGEKDADSMNKAFGVCATSHYQGGAGMKRSQAEVLVRARKVFIFADDDVTGYRLAWHHYQLLKGCGFPVDRNHLRVALPAQGSDMTDHIRAGLGRAVRLLSPRQLSSLIEEHGPLPAGGTGRWGYGYGDVDEQEWVTSRA